MAFHLEGPWLSTTGKPRGPNKMGQCRSQTNSTGSAGRMGIASWWNLIAWLQASVPGPTTAPKRPFRTYMPKTPPGQRNCSY
jgi:hypothetical protein